MRERERKLNRTSGAADDKKGREEIVHGKRDPAIRSDHPTTLHCARV